MNEKTQILNRSSEWSSVFKVAVLAFSLIMGKFTYAQQADKIQETVNSIKKSFYCEDQEYHTDGQRVVWVKSYKQWEPKDLAILSKEAPPVMTFLNAAAAHNRFDVLDQLLPDYFRAHGGVKVFAAAVLEEHKKSNSSPANSLKQ